MPKPLVVDASSASRLFFPGPLQSLCQSLVATWHRESTDLCAPRLWLYEMTSALSKLSYLGEVKADEGRRLLNLAHTLGIGLKAPADELARAAHDWTLRLNRVAAYDSFWWPWPWSRTVHCGPLAVA